MGPTKRKLSSLFPSSVSHRKSDYHQQTKGQKWYLDLFSAKQINFDSDFESPINYSCDNDNSLRGGAIV